MNNTTANRIATHYGVTVNGVRVDHLVGYPDKGYGYRTLERATTAANLFSKKNPTAEVKVIIVWQKETTS